MGEFRAVPLKYIGVVWKNLQKWSGFNLPHKIQKDALALRTVLALH